MEADQLPDEFPPTQFPVAFADGVSSASHGGGSAKFYLFRMDPSLRGTGEANPAVFMQVVMPSSGFAAMTVFFTRILKQMVKNGEISEEILAKLTEAAAEDGK